MRLLERLNGLPSVVEMGDYRPTDVAEAVFADLSSRVDAVVDTFNALVERELGALNKKIAGAQRGAIIAQP